MVNNNQSINQSINCLILVQSDLISRKFDFCQFPAMSVLVTTALVISQYDILNQVIGITLVIGILIILSIFLYVRIKRACDAGKY